MATKLKSPLQQDNKHKVAVRKWRNWPDICQRVFNATYEDMVGNQDLFTHPKAGKVPDEQWNTTAWNAAWIAADSCQRALKDITKMKGYAKV